VRGGLAAALTLLVFAAASEAQAETRRYAVIVAHTGDAEGTLPPLEYADDDGARYFEMFSYLADEVRLYTVLDAASQRLHPEVARQAGVPRRAAVLAGLGEVFAAIERDTRAGHSTVFYFVLVGHGKVGAGGEGYVSLLDGSFSRTDLFQEVLARSPATTNHVIVDACNAYFLVHRRGGGADDGASARRDAVRQFVAREDLARYPNTGVLLSTSSEKDTHEWSAYRAGVFSHQLRSALVGGADVNGDGTVAYSEVEAFLAAANQHVVDPEARVEVFAQAPAVDVSRPLVDLRAARFPHWLHVPAGAPLRFYLEDRRGVRYLDAHVGGEQSVVLGLVPSPHYHVRTADRRRELRVPLGQAARIDLDRKALAPPKVAARGAVEESFRLHLYEEPFGLDFYRGYVAAQGRASVDLGAARWRPGPVDAGHVDSELRRLNAAARRDVALRRRLATVAADLVRAIEVGDHEGAAELLRGAETPAPAAAR
jgi:hypothetical protein